MPQTCILVLSSPRSGSSCTTGCLHACGVSLGKNFKDHTDKHNEKGYFENKHIYHYNRDTLQKIKHNIFTLEPIPKEKVQKAFKFKDRLTGLIISEFKDQRYFACKDPRILLLLPVWLEVLSELHISVKMVLLYRDQEHTVESLIRFGMKNAKDKGEELVQIYHNMMGKAKEEYDCYELRFETLIKSPGLTIQDICKWIGVPWSAEKLLKVLEFVDKGLVHNK